MKEENVVFLENYKALSTKRQYESNWKKWMAYVTAQQPTEITIDFCVSFLKSLHEKGLASSTINTLKSALTVPIRYGFGIKWNEEPFTNFVKSCAAQRPKPPPKPISWSLAKVLEAAASIRVDSKDEKVLLEKSAFLLALASAGRISELTALQRGGTSVVFQPSGTVMLTPDPTFLAKNEPKDARWEPWSIPPLPECPSLCPVTTLKRYLEVTKSYDSGQLFRGETSGHELSKKQLAQKIVFFIERADPNQHAHVHQIRGLATSLNFLKHLCFEDLKKYTGWKSPRVFYKHYLGPISQLSVPVVAAGKIVRPSTP